MHRIAAHVPLVTLAILAAAAPMDAAELPADLLPADLVDRPLYTFNESDVDRYLTALHAAEPDLRQRVIYLGRKNINQPYEIYLLGEFPFEDHDPDPIYCLDKSDCVVFSEHMFAMALSDDWWSFLKNLQRIRYRNGEVGMLTRNHYTIAQWDRHNAFLFDDLTTKLGEGQACVPLTQVCRKANFFRKFGIGEGIPDEPISDAYIPTANVPAILKELRDADFVNIIRGNESSQYAGHVGLIAHGPDGEVNFLHSAAPAVREQPLMDYLKHNRRCLGIKILRLRDDAESIMKAENAKNTGTTEISADALNAALAARRDAAPDAVKPPRLDWRAASRLQAYRLTDDAPTDPALQAALDKIDAALGERFGIPAWDRALGVLDLNNQRLALVNPDSMFYAASVPKICTLLTYFELHPQAATELAPEIADELGRMIKRSDNDLAAKYGQLVTIDKIQETLQSRQYRLYDPQQRVGFWYGKHYGIAEPRHGDPVQDHSHAANVRQALRFYLMMEQGRLVSAAASRKMQQIFASPQLEHLPSKFVAALADRDVAIIRKSGEWENWQLDTARVDRDGHVYLIVGMTHHPRGGDYLTAAAAAVDDLFRGDPDHVLPSEAELARIHAIRQARDLIAAGELAQAEKVLRPLVPHAAAPVTTEPAQLLEITRRIRRDYACTESDVLAKIRKRLPETTPEDVHRWRDAGELQHRVLDGETRLFIREPSNLLRFSADARQRLADQTPGEDADTAFDLPEHAAQLLAEAAESKNPEIHPIAHEVTYTLTVKPGHPRLKPGAKVRCWLPFPQEYRQQSGVRLIGASPQSGPGLPLVAPNGAPHRTVYFEKTITSESEPVSFFATFAFTTRAYVPQLDPAKVQPYDTDSDLYREYTAERLPHIALTPEVRRLATEIVGDERNPLNIARKIFHWCDAHVRYCAEMEYSTIPSLSAKALASGRGDCGVQGMTFITLCRAAGIPARWQSGWETLPGRENMHDWAECHIEPWGWLPVDPSYGVQKHDDAAVRDFFFGHMDPYRMIVNLDYARPLMPPKTSFRSEPNDFQRGEIEIDGHNLYFDDWDYRFEVTARPAADAGDRAAAADQS